MIERHNEVCKQTQMCFIFSHDEYDIVYCVDIWIAMDHVWIAMDHVRRY